MRTRPKEPADSNQVSLGRPHHKGSTESPKEEHYALVGICLRTNVQRVQ